MEAEARPATQTGIQRWAVKIEYDGTGLVGWQKQRNGLSVQQILEDAAARLCGGVAVPSVTAGRTDAGVHATGQVAHLDFPPGTNLEAGKIRDGLNFFMKPHAVAVLQAARVSDTWSARFSANKRSYLYRLLNRPARPALLKNQIWQVRKPLDCAAMQAGANQLLGRHDFTSFRASACQAQSPVRTLDRLDIIRDGDLINVYAEARSFLHHQVRNMVGSLCMVGDGRWTPDHMGQALAACDRTKAGPTAPPDGLHLTAVGYDENPFI